MEGRNQGAEGKGRDGGNSLNFLISILFGSKNKYLVCAETVLDVESAQINETWPRPSKSEQHPKTYVSKTSNIA